MKKLAFLVICLMLAMLVVPAIPVYAQEPGGQGKLSLCLSSPKAQRRASPGLSIISGMHGRR